MHSFCETKNSRDLRPLFQDFTGAHPILSSFFLQQTAKRRRQPRLLCSVSVSGALLWGCCDPTAQTSWGCAAECCIPGLWWSLMRLGCTQCPHKRVLVALRGSVPFTLLLSSTEPQFCMGLLPSDFGFYFGISDLDGQGESKYCKFSKFYYQFYQVPDVIARNVTPLLQQLEPGDRKRFHLTKWISPPSWFFLLLGSASVLEGLNPRLPAVSVQIFGPALPKVVC